MSAVIDTPFSDEMTEALHIAIAKGYTCDGAIGWRTVQIKSGKEIAVRFGRD